MKPHHIRYIDIFDLSSEKGQLNHSSEVGSQTYKHVIQFEGQNAYANLFDMRIGFGTFTPDIQNL